MLDFATTAFVSILFLVDPPGTVPAFMALTTGYTPERRRKTAPRAGSGVGGHRGAVHLERAEGGGTDPEASRGVRVAPERGA